MTTTKTKTTAKDTLAVVCANRVLAGAVQQSIYLVGINYDFVLPEAGHGMLVGCNLTRAEKRFVELRKADKWPANYIVLNAGTDLGLLVEKLSGCAPQGAIVERAFDSYRALSYRGSRAIKVGCLSFSEETANQIIEWVRKNQQATGWVKVKAGPREVSMKRGRVVFSSGDSISATELLEIGKWWKNIVGPPPTANGKLEALLLEADKRNRTIFKTPSLK